MSDLKPTEGISVKAINEAWEAFDRDRYGRRKFSSMYARINDLRQAIRAHDPVAAEAAWDAVEEFVDVVFHREHGQPERTAVARKGGEV